MTTGRGVPLALSDQHMSQARELHWPVRDAGVPFCLSLAPQAGCVCYSLPFTEAVLSSPVLLHGFSP